MKIVSISQDFFDLVEGDRELMLKHNRPCIVVVRLRFRGKRRDFAVPLRSNIAPNVPKDQYFALPPRPKTRPGSIPSHAEALHIFERRSPQMLEKQAMRCGDALVPARSHLHQRLRCATTSRANRLRLRATLVCGA